MTHEAYVKSNFTVLAETGNSILFLAEGEMCAEINGTEFACNSVEEFNELVEMFGDEDLTE